jgi:hypothetical protein
MPPYSIVVRDRGQDQPRTIYRLYPSEQAALDRAARLTLSGRYNSVSIRPATSEEIAEHTDDRPYPSLLTYGKLLLTIHASDPNAAVLTLRNYVWGQPINIDAETYWHIWRAASEGAITFQEAKQMLLAFRLR